MTKKTYFASDFHLGVAAALPSREREKQIVRWLDYIAEDAAAIYLAGDLFDFWFEYRTVVPKGYVRFIGKLAELRDAGIPIYIFTGNHDMWLFDYFPQELDIPVYRQPQYRQIEGKSFLIGHGDGLGPGDKGYKRLKRLFANPLAQWTFARLHPNLALRIAHFWSGTSRQYTAEETYLGEEKEWLITYAKRKLEQQPELDYFIFGHRHLPIDVLLPNGRSRYLNLGEWMNQRSYAVFDGEDVTLHFFENPDGHVFGNTNKPLP